MALHEGGQPHGTIFGGICKLMQMCRHFIPKKLVLAESLRNCILSIKKIRKIEKSIGNACIFAEIDQKAAQTWVNTCTFAGIAIYQELT